MKAVSDRLGDQSFESRLENLMRSIVAACLVFAFSVAGSAAEPKKIGAFESSARFTAKSVMGKWVYNKDGRVGFVDDVLLDTNGTLVAYILKTGDAFLGAVAANPYRVALPPSAFQIEFDRWGEVGKLILPMWKSDIKALPRYTTERRP
jgi:hypothetical protein